MKNYVIDLIDEYSYIRKKVSDDYKNVTIHTTKRGNYGVFYKGIFTGLFMDKDLVPKEDLKMFKIINDKFV